jgi:hypothetical protein
MIKANVVRPKIVTDEHIAYLYRIQKEGHIFTVGSIPWLMREFEVSKEDALEIAVYWIKTLEEPANRSYSQCCGSEKWPLEK